MKIKKDTSLENFKNLFENFYKENNHYPTSVEIDSYFGISSRTIQRKYGSIKKLRELLGLEVTDFTTGKERADKALNSYNISLTEQEKIYNKLLPIFKKYYIHRESPFGDKSRQRSDFKIYHKEGEFYVDVFFAESFESMQGCINAKLKKYDKKLIWGDIYLINTNKNLDSIKDSLISNKKNKLPSNIKVLTEEEFFNYCSVLKSML